MEKFLLLNSRTILEEANRYESTTRKRERSREMERKPTDSQGLRLRISMGYNNLWFESRQPDFSVYLKASFGLKRFQRDGGVAGFFKERRNR